MMEESPLMPQGRKTHHENQVPLGNSNRERYGSCPQTGAKSYIHPGAPHVLAREVCGRFSFDVVFGTTVR